MAITCSECETLNPADRDTCIQCHSDLLPNPNGLEKISNIIFAVVLGLFIALLGFLPLLSTLHTPRMEGFRVLMVLIIAAGVVIMVRQLIHAVSPRALHERFLQRAAENAIIEPNQAAVDFAHAVMLAPRFQRYFLSRYAPAKLKVELGTAAKEISLCEVPHPDPARVKKIVMAAYSVIGSLSETIPDYFKVKFTLLDDTELRKIPRLPGIRREEVLQRVETILNDLCEAHLVSRIGFCKQCNEIVNCEREGSCSVDLAHGKVKRMMFLIPEDEEMMRRRLLELVRPIKQK